MASALYVKLGKEADPDCLGHALWPYSPQPIGTAIGRLVPILTRRGVRITRRYSAMTQITVARIES